MATASLLSTDIISVRQLLADDRLRIPPYQRPYKWTAKHVAQLFSDLSRHQAKSAYRLGTVVFHDDDQGRNIVDGQQRTITLLLIVHALIALRRDGLQNAGLKKQLDDLSAFPLRSEFSSAISQCNIRANYQDIQRRVARSDFDESLIDFLLNRCELVSVVLNDLAEAFQFFDAQNARGRDLEPHDLLKAYHLRAFGDSDEHLKAATVQTWESSRSKELAVLFGEYLYRIRNWSRGQSARYFGKEDIRQFKGVDIERTAAYPHVAPLRMAHHLVDEYNGHYTRRIDGQHMTFPFQLDQTIVNGRRFFEMVSHYQEQGFHRQGGTWLIRYLPAASSSDKALPILKVLNEYPGRHRTGDRHVRMLFDCLLAYYLDRFGTDSLGKAVEKAFIWAYSLRLTMQSVQLASVDNHVLAKNLFRVLREAIDPQDFLRYELNVIAKVESRRTNGVEMIFKDMKYCE